MSEIYPLDKTNATFEQLTEALSVYEDLSITKECLGAPSDQSIDIVVELAAVSIRSSMSRLSLNKNDSALILKSILPSTESFVAKETRAQAVNIVQEGLGDILLKLWNSVKAFVVTLYKNFMVLFKNITKQRLSHGERIIFLKHKIAEIKALKLKVPNNAGYLRNKTYLDFFSIAGKFSPSNITTILNNQVKLLSNLSGVDAVNSELDSYRSSLLNAINKELSNKNDWLTSTPSGEHTDNNLVNLKNRVKSFFTEITTDPYRSMHKSILGHSKKLFLLSDTNEELDGKSVVSKTPDNLSLACGFKIFLINAGTEEVPNYQIKTSTDIPESEREIEVEIAKDLQLIETIYQAVLDIQKIDTDSIERVVQKSEVMLNKFEKDLETKFKAYYDALEKNAGKKPDGLEPSLNAGVKNVALNVVKTYTEIMKSGVVDSVRLTITAEKAAIAYLDECVREFKQA